MENTKQNNREQNGITLVLLVDSMNEKGSNIIVSMPNSVQATIIKNKITHTIVVVYNPNIRIDIDLAAIQEINKQANTDISITLTSITNEKLSKDAQQVVGNRSALDLKVNYGADKQVQNFGNEYMSVAFPYTLGKNEKAENV